MSTEVDMTDEKKDITEIITVEPIPEYLLKFLLDYAEANGQKYGLVPIRIAIEYVLPEICANKGVAPSEIRVLYKHRDWIAKHSTKKGGKDA